MLNELTLLSSITGEAIHYLVSPTVPIANSSEQPILRNSAATLIWKHGPGRARHALNNQRSDWPLPGHGRPAVVRVQNPARPGAATKILRSWTFFFFSLFLSCSFLPLF